MTGSTPSKAPPPRPALLDWNRLDADLDKLSVPDLRILAIIVMAAAARRTVQAEAAREARLRVVSAEEAMHAGGFAFYEATRYLEKGPRDAD